MPSGRQPYFLIDHSVGRRGRNVRDDVLLVQFMLNEVGRPGANLMQKGYYGRAEPANLRVDGICGPKTIAEILSFQRACNGPYNTGPNKRKLIPEDATINSTLETIWADTFKLTTLGQLNFEFSLSLHWRAIRLESLESTIRRLPIPLLVRDFSLVRDFFTG